MPKMIYEDGDPVGRMEISAKDREQIAGVAARLALRWAIIVTAVMTTVIFIQQLVHERSNDWPLWANSLGWFAMVFFGVFFWKRNRLIEAAQDAYDQANALARKEFTASLPAIGKTPDTAMQARIWDFIESQDGATPEEIAARAEDFIDSELARAKAEASRLADKRADE